MEGFILQRTVVPAVCNIGERVLPTVQVLCEIVRDKRRGGEMIRETLRNQDVKAREHDQRVRVESGWFSSLRVRGGGGWVMMNSHGVEISIAGVVRKMVCANS